MRRVKGQFWHIPESFNIFETDWPSSKLTETLTLFFLYIFLPWAWGWFNKMVLGLFEWWLFFCFQLGRIRMLKSYWVRYFKRQMAFSQIKVKKWTYMSHFYNGKGIIGTDPRGGQGFTRTSSLKNYNVYIRSISDFMNTYIKMNPLKTKERHDSLAKVFNFDWDAYGFNFACNIFLSFIFSICYFFFQFIFV